MPSSRPKPAHPSAKTLSGKRYELLAAEFFEANGFDILDRNWRAGRKEIDLIARRENLIVFIEVKSSGTEKFGHPAERVDSRKVKNLSEAAAQYLEQKQIAGCDLRFDVVTFMGGTLEHFPNAFQVE